MWFLFSLEILSWNDEKLLSKQKTAAYSNRVGGMTVTTAEFAAAFGKIKESLWWQLCHTYA